MSLQRLRVTFSQTGDLRFLSHLDVVRLWHRALRRARLPVAYTQGFNPQPRLAFAAALPVGHAGHRELVDVWLETPWEPEAFLRAVEGCLPQGISLLACLPVPLHAPSLQSQVRAAQYRVTVLWGGAGEEAKRRVVDFLARERVPWCRVRRRKEETLDLRPLVLGARVEECSEGACRLWLRLRAGAQGGVRPEDVVRALGMPEAALVERLCLELEEPPSQGGAGL
ncbi:MAG: TIGR03936 family radical SAM-associated protein [Anaerolineae bacterium]